MIDNPILLKSEAPIGALGGSFLKHASSIYWLSFDIVTVKSSIFIFQNSVYVKLYIYVDL